jgi:hypothetical protein
MSTNSALEMSDAEQEQHIADLGLLMIAAYQKYEISFNPADRREAQRFAEMHKQAILARSEAVKTARHSAFERRLDEGVDFFAVHGARDGRAIHQEATNGR